jgi:hypothetical protein
MVIQSGFSKIHIFELIVFILLITDPRSYTSHWLDFFIEKISGKPAQVSFFGGAIVLLPIFAPLCFMFVIWHLQKNIPLKVVPE